MTDTVLVTAAAGTTGGALVRQLTDHDVSVRAAVHSRGSAGDVVDTADSVVEIDMTDPGTLPPPFEGTDRAYFLTPFVPDQTPLVENLVDAAMDADVAHLIRHSALGAGRAEPPDALAANHSTAEDIVAKAGAATTFVRPTSFMQNLLNDVASIREQGPISERVYEIVQSGPNAVGKVLFTTTVGDVASLPDLTVLPIEVYGITVYGLRLALLFVVSAARRGVDVAQYELLQMGMGDGMYIGETPAGPIMCTEC